jgi:hypothetical protein
MFERLRARPRLSLGLRARRRVKAIRPRMQCRGKTAWVQEKRGRLCAGLATGSRCPVTTRRTKKPPDDVIGTNGILLLAAIRPFEHGIRLPRSSPRDRYLPPRWEKQVPTQSPERGPDRYARRTRSTDGHRAEIHMPFRHNTRSRLPRPIRIANRRAFPRPDPRRIGLAFR